MITLVRDKINKVVLPGLFCTEDGTYNLTLSFNNEGQEKKITAVGVMAKGRLRFDLEHTCGNINTLDNKINFDIGSYAVSISEEDNLLINTFIKIQ
jgi:hypothetical protein